MTKPKDSHPAKWLQKLERESWQLELLVSAFTIFLLFQGIIAFEGVIAELTYKYNVGASFFSFVFIFANLLFSALKALAFFMVSHLLLRGFWIGTIGLKSVQSKVDFDTFNYSPFFTKKLKESVVSLDQLVFKLDEICSVIFAFAFLVLSVLISFGMYLGSIGLSGLLVKTIAEASPGWLGSTISAIFMFVVIVYLIFGLIYLIDYFTLGFFKRLKWFSKIYYPFYRTFYYVTLAFLSQSIYYHLISKFSKRRIRLIYAIGLGFVLTIAIFDYDQYQYATDNESPYLLWTNVYDDQRPSDEYIARASIPSAFVNQDFLPLFLRYDPADNMAIRKTCPDYTPLKADGVNFAYRFVPSKTGLHFTSEKFEGEDIEALMECRKSIYRISFNDSLYANLDYFFYEHPAKKQRGLLSYVPAENFKIGQNTLTIEKAVIVSQDSISFQEFALIPFWYSE